MLQHLAGQEPALARHIAERYELGAGLRHVADVAGLGEVLALPEGCLCIRAEPVHELNAHIAEEGALLREAEVLGLEV